MRGTGKRTRAIAAGLLAAAALSVYLLWPFVAAAALLMDLSGAMPAIRRLLPVRVAPVQLEDVSVPTRHGAIAARRYHAGARATRTIVVVPGVHAGGVDEPRLDALARRLAGGGAIVLSLPLPDLRAYRVTATSTDMIEDAARWMIEQPDTVDGRVGLIGVSFSGGLAIVAAGRESIRDRLTAVVSLGGHGDLPRAMRYLCTGLLPDGTVRRPHDYGVAILLRAALPRLVPPAQVQAIDRALVAYLDASSLAAAEPARAAGLLDESTAISASLEEPARSIMQWVQARDVDRIGPMLLPFTEDIGGAPAMSPERSPLPRAPVFLVHGIDDNVIPSSETPALAAHIRRASGPPVQWLLTPLISHADLQPAVPAADVWRLVKIWTAAWKELGN